MCSKCVDAMTQLLMDAAMEYTRILREWDVHELNNRHAELSEETDSVAAEVRGDIMNELHRRALSE